MFWLVFFLSVHLCSSPCCVHSAQNVRWKHKHNMGCFFFFFSYSYICVTYLFKYMYFSIYVRTHKYSHLFLHSPLGLPKKFTTLARGPTPSKGTPMPQWSRATGFTNRYSRKTIQLEDYGMCVSLCRTESGQVGDR